MQLYLFELLRLWRSLRLRISVFIILCVFTAGSRFFVEQYAGQMTNYEKLEHADQEKLLHLSQNLTWVANDATHFYFSPRQDGFLFSCKETDMANTIKYRVWDLNGIRMTQGPHNPLLSTDSTLDWSFAVSVFMSFLALLFSYDSVCGERRDHVLSFLFSYPVSRKAYLLSKFFAIWSVMGGLLLGGIMVGMIALWDTEFPLFTTLLFARIAGFFWISLLLLGVFVAFGLLASVWMKHSNVSLLLCVCFWLFSVVIMPNSAVFWANYLFPIAPFHSIQMKIDEESKRLLLEAPAGSLSSSETNPFYRFNENRAVLQMKQNDATNRISGDYLHAIFRQTDGVRRLMLLSPVMQYEQAMETWLGGGYLRFQKNWKDLQAFRLTFESWFKAEDAKDPKSPHWYNPFEDISTSKKPVEVERIPRYAEKPYSLSYCIRGVIGFVLVYVGMLFILYLITLRLFSKQDLR